jgi:hypothetical protein
MTIPTICQDESFVERVYTTRPVGVSIVHSLDDEDDISLKPYRDPYIKKCHVESMCSETLYKQGKEEKEVFPGVVRK